jgi:hypothetical protein
MHKTRSLTLCTPKIHTLTLHKRKTRPLTLCMPKIRPLTLHKRKTRPLTLCIQKIRRGLYTQDFAKVTEFPRADLSHAYLVKANFRGAQCQEANFWFAPSYLKSPK